MANISELQKLIGIPSLSGNEREIQAYIKESFGKFGIESLSQNGNLLVHLKGKDLSRAFIFNSHVDVVDPGDPSKWMNNDPWSGKIYEGKIYGRGTSDMKSGVFASMELAKALAQRPTLPCDAWFTYVVKEETDGSGTKSFAEWFKNKGYTSQYKKMVGIFTEPTSLTTVENGHRGTFFIKAALEGNDGHASRPRLIKTHAIKEMAEFIEDLNRESNEWEKRFKDTPFQSPTITPTAIKAESTSPNRVSSYCEAVFDLRTIPGFHEEAFQEVMEVAKRRGINLSLICPDSPTGFTDPNATIIKVMQEIIPGVKLEVSEAAADLGFLTDIGVEGVIFGPGEKLQEHTTNEFAYIGKIVQAPKLYEQIYDSWAQISKV